MSRALEDLEPDVARKVRAVMEYCAAKGHPLRVIHTYRSSDEQARQHAKGREIPGEPCRHVVNGKVELRKVGSCSAHPLGATVTRAKPGGSWHEYRRAADFAFVVNGKPSWDDSLPWHLIGEACSKVGLEWGVRMANGKRGDLGHVQDRGGMTIAEARAAADGEGRIRVA